MRYNVEVFVSKGDNYGKTTFNQGARARLFPRIGCAVVFQELDS